MGNKGSTTKGGKGGGEAAGGSAPTAKKAKKLKKWGPYQQQPAETEGDAWLCTVESDVLPASFPDERSVKKFLRDYVHVTGKEGEVVVFKPGSLFGLDVTIKECVNCDIYVCDNTAAVTVVDCRDCRMVIGPCDTSVFVRSSKGCKFAIACQQFRSADMKNTDLLLFTQTEPVIERVSKLRLGCLRLAYDDLEAQFARTGINLWNNRWSEVFDFTKNGGGGLNWELLPPATTAVDLLGGPLKEDPALAALLGLGADQRDGPVMYTAGMPAVTAITAGEARSAGGGGGGAAASAAGEVCFIGIREDAWTFARELVAAAVGDGSSGVQVALSHIQVLDAEKVASLFSAERTTAANWATGPSGTPYLGLALVGPGSIAAAEGAVAEQVARGGTSSIALSRNAAAGAEQAMMFFVDWKVEV